MTLTVIGYGKMAKSMIIGFVNSGFDVEVVGRNQKKLEDIKSISEKISIKILDNFNINNKNIIFAVKPYALDEVSSKLHGKASLFLSVLAGTKLDTIKSKIDSESYVRVMPNLAAAKFKSMNTIVGDDNNKDLVDKIVSCIGKILWLNSEKELDIATAIAGSGPAFLALVAEALADGGVNCGLKRDDAKKIVEGLFYGFSDILPDYKSAANLKDDVMSPAGTTSAGYYALEKNSVRNAFIDAIYDANKRAKEIANS
jgi:pyrroline-5-carboxylate reductase